MSDQLWRAIGRLEAKADDAALGRAEILRRLDGIQKSLTGEDGMADRHQRLATRVTRMETAAKVKGAIFAGLATLGGGIAAFAAKHFG